MFSLEFKTSNAAFEDDPAVECGLILQRISRLLTEGAIFGKVYDTNGNHIGEWVLEKSEPDDEA